MRADLIETYEKYMRETHIHDLLETGFFSGAKFTRSANGSYRIQYEAHDQTALEEYLKKEASRLREDFLAYFPFGIEIEREIREVVQIF